MKLCLMQYTMSQTIVTMMKTALMSANASSCRHALDGVGPLAE